MSDSLRTIEMESFETQSSTSWLNLPHLMWRHRSLLLLGILAGGILGGLYYFRATPIYQSSAQVLVVKKTPEGLPIASGEARATMADDYLSTHQTLIHSPVIVGEAVRRANLEKLPAFAGFSDPTGPIIAALKVSREMNSGSPTSILNISFQCSQAEDAPQVVKAVIESYKSFLQAKYKDGTDETAKLIAQANDLLEKRLTAKQNEYNDFLVKQPSLMRGKNGISAVQERLLGLEAKRSSLLLQEAELQGRIATLEKALQDGHYSRAELLAMLPRTSNRMNSEGNTANLTAEDRLMALELQEKSLQEEGYGPDHPQVRAIRDQLRLLRSRMKRLEEGKERADSELIDPLKTHIEALKLELENTRMAAQALSKMLQEEQRNTEPLRSYEKKDEAYRIEIARSQQLFNTITKHLDEVSILKNFSGGYEAEIISPPGVGFKVHPRPFAVLAPALILGLLAGIGLVYLAELADQGFRTPEEIRRRLGMPVVGHIPDFRADEEAEPVGDEGRHLAPALRALHQPKSLEAEAYRGVRTALFFHSRERGHTVIQVTSPDMGDGKSTLIANLAISIAQAEKTVILIDADFRRPRIHKLFDVSPRQGLASVIGGEAELQDVIQSTPVPGLSVLPCGPIPANPAELLTLPRFRELLAYIREHYDYVLIDTPPLLAVTDPCVVVPHVDGVLLTVRISKNARPHAGRAREILSTLGAKIIGVVVNGIGPDSKSYHYGVSYKYYDEYSSSGNSFDNEPETGAGDGLSAGGTVVKVKKKVASARRMPRKKAGLLAWLFDR